MMKNNSPAPELCVVNVSQFKSVFDGCSITLLQKLKEVQSDLNAWTYRLVNHDQIFLWSKLFKPKTPKWFVWYSLQLINTSVFICHEEILGIAIPFLFQDIPRGRWLSGCHDTKLHSEVGQAPVNKAGTPTPSLNTEKRNLMSWMSKTKLQTHDITRANTCFWWVSEQVSSWNNTKHWRDEY